MSDETLFSKRKLTIFASYYKPHLGLFVLDLACALGMALVDLGFPLVTRYSIQNLLPRQAYGLFALVIAGCFLAFAFRGGLQYIVTYWGHVLGVKMETDMRRDLFTHMQKLSFSFYDRTRTGHLMSRVVSDLFEIVELAHHGPEDLFIATITLSGSLIAMAAIRWQLAIVLLLVVPVVVLITVKRRKSLEEAALEVKRKTAAINANLENSISGVREAKAFANEDYEIEKFVKGNDVYRDTKRFYYKAMGSFHAGMEFSTSALNVLVIGVGGYFVARRAIDLGDLIAFTLYVGAFLQPIRKLVAFFEQYSTGMAGFDRFVELMRVEPEIVDKKDALRLDSPRGEIEFRNVSFSYSGSDEVLSDVNLKIPAGSTCALVGPSGGGKTTLCRLIPRFYEASQGIVTIDGIDVRDIRLSSLRENIGIVQQDIFLFADTIRENIRYGRLNATDEQIMEAARRADIHEFILSLSDGYDTLVGERGVMLSGGQKQRLSIARIFLKNPPILILDEATSALDSVTESRIQKAFEELSEGRTSLVIAHRLSTIRKAPKIVLIDDEGIAEEGNHEQLLAAGGRYAALYGSQYGMDTVSEKGA